MHRSSIPADFHPISAHPIFSGMLASLTSSTRLATGPLRSSTRTRRSRVVGPWSSPVPPSARRRLPQGQGHSVRGARLVVARMALKAGDELPLDFAGLPGEEGKMTIAGFGSLLSERSSRFTFPNLENFRTAKLQGWRRVFAHAAPVFFERGIARMETREFSSLSCEPHRGAEIVVTLFEVPADEASIAAFIEREHEFRFVAVQPLDLATGGAVGRLAVLCGRYSDEEYKTVRCKEGEFHQRYGRHGIDQIWMDDLLPCRTYLRHCVLAAEKLGPAAHASFLDQTFLGDRATTIRQHLEGDPTIMAELPPPALAERYSG